MSAIHPCLIVVVGGIHPPGLTTPLLLAAAADPVLGQIPTLVLPNHTPATVLSPRHLRHGIDHYWQSTFGATDSPDLLIWAFSAGCVGAVGLGHHWHHHRGKVRALFAVDGWGVPLPNCFPTYRLSHDEFTHTTSQWLGTAPVSFWADPPVPHLQFWGQIPTTQGWQTTVGAPEAPQPQRMTAGEFLFHWSRRHLTSAPAPGEELSSFFNSS